MKPKVKPPLPTINKKHPLAKVIVACYPFQDKCGTTLRDISEYNNKGTLTLMDPATDWVRTPYGYGLDFDGTDDHINIPHSDSLMVSANATWIFRIKFNSLSNNPMIITKYTDINNNGYYIYMHSTVGLIFANAVSAIHYQTYGNTPPVLGTWYQYKIVKNGSSVKMYRNGAVLPNTNEAVHPNIVANTGATLIGHYPAQYFNGLFDSVLLLNGALSVKEIATLYADPWSIYKITPEYKRYLGKAAQLDFPDMFLAMAA